MSVLPYIVNYYIFMAAAYGNTNSSGVSKGKGGKSLQDRELAAELRSLTMQKCKKALENEEGDPDLYKAVLLKLAGTVLPRLNEHSGPDGEKLIPIYGEQSIQGHNSNKEDIQPKKTNKGSSGGDLSEQDHIYSSVAN